MDNKSDREVATRTVTWEEAIALFDNVEGEVYDTEEDDEYYDTPG